MRTIPLSLIQHLSGEVTTIATCWKIVRVDSVVLGFTDHDRDLSVDGIVYDSIAGFTASTVVAGNDMAVDNMEITGSMGSGMGSWSSKITESDLLGGRYDFAAVETFLVNYLSPDSGKLVQKCGTIGEVTLSGNMFHAEIRGLNQALSQNVSESCSPDCRAELGDKRCKFDLSKTGFTATAKVSKVISNGQFLTDKLEFEKDWFSGGCVSWLSGKNKGLKMEVKAFADGEVTLMLPMVFTINVGDKFSITAGCDKRKSTCINKFGNIINFRGEPDIPGKDKLSSPAT